MASLITITTDFGTRDGFVAQMKGVILGINPAVGLIDVTHDIQPYAVLEGALVLKGVSRSFPSGTIHVGVVDPGVGGARRGIVARSGDQVFVGPDNGLFSLVFQSSEPLEIREIRNPQCIAADPHPTFHGRDVFAPVAAHLSLGKPPEVMGPRIDDPELLSVAVAEETDNEIHGEVVYIDRFGNLSSNIEARMIIHPRGIVRVGNIAIHGISRFFQEKEEGEAVALVNSFGLLEIAVNRGDAAKSLGIHIGAPVKVTWTEG